MINLNPTISKNYAKALIAVWDRDILELEESLLLMHDVFFFDASLKIFFESKNIDYLFKQKIVEKVFEGKIPFVLISFLQLLIQKRRENIFFSIYNAVCEENDKIYGRVKALVFVSCNLEFECKDPESSLHKKIKEVIESNKIKLNLPNKISTISIKVKIMPEILGGIVIKIGDYVLDISVKKFLQDYALQVRSHSFFVDKVWEN